MTITTEQIVAMAKAAWFYVTPDGEWLRMSYVNEEDKTFTARNESAGEDGVIECSDVKFTGHESFYALRKMEMP
jgi:hypothetical protein